MKVIIGAGNSRQEGWIATQQEELNLLKREDFEKMFSKERPTAFLAEHVFEHMHLTEAFRAAKNCYDFLQNGGYIRAAVPDGNFRNEAYRNLVKAGGNGDPSHPAYDHKILYDYKTFKWVFERAGFVVEMLEYCDDDGNFHYRDWNESDGRIGRSLRFDTRNALEEGKLGMVSIILDARKMHILPYEKQK